MKTITVLSNLVEQIHLTVKYFRIQDFFHGNKSFNKTITLLNEVLPSLTSPEIKSLTQSLQLIYEAQNNSDYILLCDMLEISLLPSIKNILEELIISCGNSSLPQYFSKNIEALQQKNAFDNSYIVLSNQILHTCENIKSFSGYNIELTNLGIPTVKKSADNRTFYYHSNINPYSEGYSFAEYYSKDNIFSYNVLGFGLGYHIKGLLDYDRRFSINVIETNIEILTLAFMYCDLTEIISNRRFSLKYSNINEINDFLRESENIPLLIHYPSLRALEDSSAKQLLNNYFINISSMYSQQKYLDWNFYDNLKLESKSANVLKDKFIKKNVIYVAGGPSLKYYTEYLHACCHNSDNIIICASTIYRTLIAWNIIPDYVIMTDAQDNMISHVENIKENNCSLIYLSTACSAAVNEFNGEKYILFQKGYPPAEESAQKNNIPIIESGGSVSTAAIDLILKFNCSSLTTIGLDLAYTDNKSHSYDEESFDTSTDFIYVKSVSRNTVPTTNVLNIYRLWIEKRIEHESSVKLINMSHGAYINGMENII